MSRVFEALCRSQQELGSSDLLLNPEMFLEKTATVPQTGEPDWGQVPVFQAPELQQRLVALSGQNGLGAEKFRLLKARLRHLQDRTQIKRVVVTSSVPGEGKTLVAANLAISLARNTSQRVLLVDGDLHKASVGERLGLTGARGIWEWYGAEEPIHRFLYRLQDTQLWVLCAGMSHTHPAAILQSPRFLDLFRRLGEMFDWIIIDVPPLLPLADASLWARQADGVLVVVRQGKAQRTLLQKGLEALDHPRILGVIFNDIQALESDYYNQYYATQKQPS